MENNIKPDTAQRKSGKAVLPYLAELYPQLYLAPGEEGERRYRDVVGRGAEPEPRTLEHFITSDADLCTVESTPVGEVRVVTLQERADFETFMRIIANRCAAVAIPRTQGASTVSGVISWGRIRAHLSDWLASQRESGEEQPDTNEELRRFTADRKNYTDTLIVLSVGPYSGVDGAKLGVGAEDWLRISNDIRKYHELTHFICRALYPEKKDAVRDELAADAVGIYAALGRFDINMAETFLGVAEDGYRGGRLENYVAEGEDLNALAPRVHAALSALDGFIRKRAGAGPFELAAELGERELPKI